MDGEVFFEPVVQSDKFVQMILYAQRDKVLSWLLFL